MEKQTHTHTRRKTTTASRQGGRGEGRGGSQTDSTSTTHSTDTQPPAAAARQRGQRGQQQPSVCVVTAQVVGTGRQNTYLVCSHCVYLLTVTQCQSVDSVNTRWEKNKSINERLESRSARSNWNLKVLEVTFLAKVFFTRLFPWACAHGCKTWVSPRGGGVFTIGEPWSLTRSQLSNRFYTNNVLKLFGILRHSNLSLEIESSRLLFCLVFLSHLLQTNFSWTFFLPTNFSLVAFVLFLFPPPPWAAFINTSQRLLMLMLTADSSSLLLLCSVTPDSLGSSAAK